MAAVVAAISLGIGLIDFRASPRGALSEGEIVTGPGERTTVTLSDDSSIRLGPNSRLRLSETADRRVAWLSGRALFGVRSNPERPFIVYTDHGEARVLGTRFEVNANDHEFTVMVVEGRVSVSAGGDELDLVQGQIGTSVEGRAPSAAQVDDVYERLNWIGTSIVLQATPLADAAREVERRFGVQVDIVDPGLESLLITAAFTGQTVQEVMLVVCETIRASCSFGVESIRIERRPPGTA